MKVAAAFAVLSLLLAPVTAAAECAWVMWEEATEHFDLGSGPMTHTEWLPANSSKTREECEKNKPRSKPDRIMPNSPTGHRTKYRYVCFPDVTDPRGAKGGQR